MVASCRLISVANFGQLCLTLSNFVWMKGFRQRRLMFPVRPRVRKMTSRKKRGEREKEKNGREKEKGKNK